MYVDYAVSAFVTLLVVVDPVGLAPIFISLTHKLDPLERRVVAIRAALMAGGILIGCALIGDWLLRQLGISLSAFRIAGGLLLFAIAFEMVYGQRTGREARNAEQAVHMDHFHHIAAFPLAIPLLAGPGAITATILLAGQAAERPAIMAILLAIIALVAALSLLTFWLASPIGRALGVTGNLLLSRLLGIVLAALAVQYVIDGVRAALHG